MQNLNKHTIGTMVSKLTIALVFLFFSATASAQTTENPIKQEIKEETTFNGYTIVILHA
jgi:hypothetical protein